MPVSVPRQAPERHHRGHLFFKMVKMDICSIGLVYLWLLFNEKLYEYDLVFDALPDKRPHPLGLKKQNGQDEIAERLARETIKSSAIDLGDLGLFFQYCLASTPESRLSDMSFVIKLLGAKSPIGFKPFLGWEGRLVRPADCIASEVLRIDADGIPDGTWPRLEIIGLGALIDNQ